MKRFSKLLAVALAVVMVFSLNFIPASAAEPATGIKMAINGTSSAAASTVTVAVGDRLPVYYLARPSRLAELTDVVYTSSDTSVVAVSGDYISAKKAGKVTLTATGKNEEGQEVTGTVTVKVVKKARATSISIIPVSLTTFVKNAYNIGVGQSLVIRTNTNPAGASKMMSYKSSKPSVATVNADGKIDAIKAGTTKITVTTKDGSRLSKTITISVIDATEKAVERVLNVGDVNKVTNFIKITPYARVDAEKITYESSNPEVLQVEKMIPDANGNPKGRGKLTAIKAGTAEITVIDAEANFAKSFTFTVVGGEEPGKEITDIKVENIDDFAKLYVDGTATIKATAVPEEAETGFTYESADPEIASVDENGNVTGKKSGTTTIKVTSTANPEISTTITVTVKEKEILTKVAKWKDFGDDKMMELSFGEFHWTTGNISELADQIQEFIKKTSSKLEMAGADHTYTMTINGAKYEINLLDTGMKVVVDGKELDIKDALAAGQSPDVKVQINVPENYIETFLAAMEEGKEESSLIYNGVAMSALNFIGYNFEFFGKESKVDIVYKPTGEVYHYDYFVSEGILYFRGDVRKDPIMTERLNNPDSDRCIFETLELVEY